MFNLFRKKNDTIKVIDKILLSEKAKFTAILDRWKADPELVILTWFPETCQQLTTLFAKETSSPVSLFMVKEIHASQVNGKNILFAEHHPLHKKEVEAFRQLHLEEAIIYSSLDEALFKHFGGEKIIGLMKQLGAEETSVLEHKMISNAIENAQEKMESKVVTEQTANSQQEWIERNLPS